VDACRSSRRAPRHHGGSQRASGISPAGERFAHRDIHANQPQGPSTEDSSE